MKLPNDINLSLLSKLLTYSDRYDISIQFWSSATAVYIQKNGIDLQDYGGEFDFAIQSSIDYLDRINAQAKNQSKGVLNGKCNITSCQKPNSATWYNHSTRKYYCHSCANRLNNDEFNKRDAMRMFGHALCTEVIDQ